jgi:hypothetical protein
MEKHYIKMNENNILSLGNFCNVMKKNSSNNIAIQSEVFYALFDVNNINATTINNYCIGIRGIGIEYKKEFEEKYNNNKLIDSVLSLVNLLDNKINQGDKLEIINNSSRLQNVINDLQEIVKKDDNIIDKNKFNKDTKYETITSLLHYIILENKQPVYINEDKININNKELNEYLKVKLLFGENYIESLLSLANKENVYACAEIGSLYYDGIINGYQEFEKAFKYYLMAAKKDHPKACWMIANMILNKRVKYDFDTMWSYLNKAISLNSAASYNTMGLCWLRKINPEQKEDKEKAIKYFKKSADFGYVYAFNNLGLIYEKDNPDLSLEYFKMSAELNNSWALNKVGEYYRKNGELDKAKLYYKKAISSQIKERNAYAYFNLANYYYKDNEKKYTEYMNMFNKLKKED